MIKFKQLLITQLALMAFGTTSSVAQVGSFPISVPATLGEVHFDTSCASEVEESFNVAVAMLHSFEFDESRLAFEQVATEEPSCAMAYWGIAMTLYHPLWAPPPTSDLEQGATAVANARNLADSSTQREQLYIEAIGNFFDYQDNSSHRERAHGYENSMAQVVEANPNDREAEIFYLLARLSNADPTDKSYAVQNQIGPLFEQLFVEMPEHPGIAHYIIHSYDYPELADRAEQAADRYLEIAKSMPHALHMSGHIYTLLGLWNKAVHANMLSVDAAVNRAQMFDLGEGTQNELHSLDYLVYAYLQQGANNKAREIVERVESFQNLNMNNGVIAFNAVAVPVRYAIERQDWEAAANIPLIEEENTANWNDQIWNSQALIYWARIIGAAKRSEFAQAEADLVELEKISESLQSYERIWGRNTAEVFRLQVTAWLTLEKGEHEGAESLMREAAALEDQTDKSSISPGRVLPAHEQLGDLLAALNRPEEALAAYEESMPHAPERLNTYLGAAKAATATGKTELARSYNQKLSELASR
ncbi:MAG: hypothetical protein GKR91_06035 [Pseudomonadales bacterium]|nr:hypothetical protein [Pseudomonadales bacterium]